MFHVSTLLAAAETHVALAMPTWAYGVIAFAVFLILAGVTFSYRDVANRKPRSGSASSAAHGHAHQGTDHSEGH